GAAALPREGGTHRGGARRLRAPGTAGRLGRAQAPPLAPAALPLCARDAHIRRGTQPVAELAPERLAQVAGELVRLLAPDGTDLSGLPLHDPALAEVLERALPAEERAALAPLAVRAALDPSPVWTTLPLAIRETAERTALVICGDPAAALSIVLAECPGGLDRPEVARLARFAVSEQYLSFGQTWPA